MQDKPNLPLWYQERRRKVEAVFATATSGAQDEHTSPSGRYRLKVARYATGPDTWAFSRGDVTDAANGGLIATIDRNIGSFPFSWCERHPSGHDYLLAGEDYQGQTIIELDSGKRVDHVAGDAERGFGFCWAAHYPSPDGRFLFVDGCIWAAPYEMILYDFSDPMRLPYAELKRWPVWKVDGFSPDGSFTFEYDENVRKADGVPVHELTEDQRDALDAADDYDAVVAERRVRVVWHPDFTEEISIVV